MNGDTGMQRWEVTRSKIYIINGKQGWDLITSKFKHGMEVPGILGVVWMLAGDLRVQDLTRIPWDSMGFGLWFQLVHCAYPLTLSEYFK